MIFSLAFGLAVSVLLFRAIAASSTPHVELTKFQHDVHQYRIKQAASTGFLYREKDFRVEPGCGLAHLVAKLNKAEALSKKK